MPKQKSLEKITERRYFQRRGTSSAARIRVEMIHIPKCQAAKNRNFLSSKNDIAKRSKRTFALI